MLESLSGLGALKASLIDVATSDGDIAKHLEDTLHSALPELDGPAVSSTSKPRCLPDLCHSHSSYNLVRRWQTAFKKHLSDEGVRPGALLVFTSNAFPEAHTFFLGVVLERPSVHALMSAELVDNEARILVNGGLPCVQTERALFQQLLVIAGRVTDINVEVWHCQACLREGSVQQLYTTPDRKLCSFVLPERVLPKPKRAPVALPFGLQLPAAKRARRPQQRGQPTRRKPKSATASASSQATGAVVVDVEASAAVSVSDSSESSAVTEASADDAELCEAEEFDDDANVEAESERVAPMTAEAASSEACIPVLEKELDREDDLRTEVAQAIRSKQPGPGRSSFFSKELGLAEGGLAASGRAVCYSCKLPIPKGSVRFSWHHSLYRPPAWVHSSCVCDLVKKTGLRDVASRRLFDISRQGPGSAASSSAAPAVPEEVVRMAGQLYRALGAQSTAAGSG